MRTEKNQTFLYYIIDSETEFLSYEHSISFSVQMFIPFRTLRPVAMSTYVFYGKYFTRKFIFPIDNRMRVWYILVAKEKKITHSETTISPPTDTLTQHRPTKDMAFKRAVLLRPHREERNKQKGRRFQCTPNRIVPWSKSEAEVIPLKM